MGAALLTIGIGCIKVSVLVYQFLVVPQSIRLTRRYCKNKRLCVAQDTLWSPGIYT